MTFKQIIRTLPTRDFSGLSLRPYCVSIQLLGYGSPDSNNCHIFHRMFGRVKNYFNVLSIKIKTDSSYLDTFEKYQTSQEG
jgi:hypothetical protein